MKDLEDILVVSLEQAVAAPYASGRMAEAGARVIKIERAEGDFARHYDDFVLGQSAYFVWLNAGKESITMDLRTEGDAELLRNMLKRADVFIQNLAPGAVGRLGFEPKELRQRFPSLIICSISGYGDSGPYQYQKAYDLLIQAETGLCSVTGVGEELTRVGVSVSDISAGMTAYEAILQALLARFRSGDGRIINVSLFHSTADWMNVPYLQHRYAGFVPKNSGLQHPSIAPYGAFQCADLKAVLISIQNDREWRSLCEFVLGDADLAGHEDYKDNASRLANREKLDNLVASVFAGHIREDIIKLLESASIAYGRLSDLDDLAAHPQNRFRKIETKNGIVEALGRGAETEEIVNEPLRLPEIGQDSEKIREEFRQ